MRTLQPSNQQTILVLSAGAPNSPLGAGALHALLAREGAASIDFKRIYASGGGVILALLYVAPKGIARCKGDRNAERAHRLKALAALPQQLGIDDRIYKRLPLGYKAFVKRSSWYGVMRSLTAPFKIESDSDSALAQRFPLLEKFKKTLDTRLPESNKRLYNDLVDAMTVIMTPAVFVPRSKRMREQMNVATSWPC